MRVIHKVYIYASSCFDMVSNSSKVFALGTVFGIVMMIGISGLIPTATADQSTNNISSQTLQKSGPVSINSGPVQFSVSENYSMNLSVSANGFNITFTNLNPDTGIEGIEGEHKQLKEAEAESAQTGLCAVGLGDEDSLPFGVKDNGDISSEADPAGSPESYSASDVVDKCTEYSGYDNMENSW